MLKISGLVLAALLPLLSAPSGAVSYSYDSYRIWGLWNSAAGEGIKSADINVKGTVVGAYLQLDASNNPKWHSYVLQNGQMTYPVDYQGATNTILLAVNRANTAVGVVQVIVGTDVTPRTYGVVYESQGFRIVEHPNALYTALTSINDRGEIAGYYRDASTRALVGFIYRNGKFSDLKAQIPQLVSLTGINGQGRVSGVQASYKAPFWAKDKKVQLLTTPTEVYGPQGLVPWVFINDRGNLAGSSSGTGFFWKSGALRQVAVPGSRSTVVEDLNNRDQLALVGVLPNGIRQSYLYGNGQFTSLVVTDAAESMALSVNDLGTVVGTYAVSPQGVFDRVYVARGQ